MTDEQFADIEAYVKKHAPVTQGMRELMGPLFDVQLHVLQGMEDDQLIFNYGAAKAIGMSPGTHAGLRSRLRYLEREQEGL